MSSKDPLAAAEPLFDPEDTPTHGLPRPGDTPPHGISRAALRPKPPRTNAPPRRDRGWINALLLAAAALITILAAVFYLREDTVTAPPPTAADLPTRLPPTQPPVIVPPTETPILPTPAPLTSLTDTSVPPDVIAELLRHPGYSVPPSDGIYRVMNAYTIAPARTRSSIIQYTIRPGDTLDVIAERFGLSTDTLVWNNDGIYVNRLLPGDSLTILPENGVLHKTLGEETIQAIADKYNVSPYVIIDSEFNPILRNASPTTLIPPGIQIMVPGGTSDKKAVYWDPGIQISSSGGAGSSAGTASFGGGPGSCGAQPNTGGSGSLVVPLPPNYVVMRGFTSSHTGIDLSAPTGTTVFAADGGTVIFAGWSNWGYGNTVVIAHGWVLTLYGHLSRVSVSCGQQVSKGTPIGTVGSTGNSSGPHLHFEVRQGQTPVNPEGYLVF